MKLFGPPYFLSLIFLISLLCYGQKPNNTQLEKHIDLEKWKTVKSENQKFWSITGSIITGGDGIQKIPQNTYLYSNETYGDFELRCLFRLTGDHDKGLINSGIQYRSSIENYKIIGYQADIGKGYWGDIYDEHRRGKLVQGNLEILKHLLDEDGWNSFIVRCKGNKHELYINGIKTAEYFEEDSKISSNGVIGLQLHSGGNAKIEFKYITITIL